MYKELCIGHRVSAVYSKVFEHLWFGVSMVTQDQ